MKYAFLAILARSPAHGYEIKQAFDETFGDVWPPMNFGQIYSTLGRLQRDGLVESEHVSQESRRDKRVYSLTRDGRKALGEWAASPTESPRLKDDFFMKLILGQMAGIAEPSLLIERQRHTYLQALHELNQATLKYGNGKDAIPALLIEGAALHLQADLEWLDILEAELTSEERTLG